MFHNINHSGDWARRLLTDDSFFFGVLIVLVSITSFGLGRWSVVDTIENTKPIEAVQMQASLPATLVGSVQTPTSTEIVTKDVSKVEQKYVASRKGTKYHLLWCAGAKSIKEENKIYFATKEQAQKSGYSPASNCKGI